jgi:hypothetical protein
MKVGQNMLQGLTKVHGIKKKFQSKTFSFNEILSHFISLMDEIFRFTQNIADNYFVYNAEAAGAPRRWAQRHSA